MTEKMTNEGGVSTNTASKDTAIDNHLAAEQPSEDLETMKQRVAEMQQEAEKLREMQETLARESAEFEESKEEVDARSVFVGNVDFGATPEELQSHFASCGAINRITILCDKAGRAKGYAYIEFAEPNQVSTAVDLNESTFRDRPIKVVSKRTNKPGLAYRGRGRGRGYFRGYRGYRSRGGFRNRGRGFAPY